MEREGKKVLLTGGHLSPLLAVLGKLSNRAECVVIGRKQSFEGDNAITLEYEILKEKNIKFYNLPSSRLQRKVTIHTISSLLRFPYSFLEALNILKKEKPDVVLTFGGYIGLPVSLVAKTLRIPVVLHEQTLRAGLTNRIIGRVAVKICISYNSSRKYFPEVRTILTGNPVRNELFRVIKGFDIPKNLPVVYVTGGSTGAHRINMYIELLLPKLLTSFVVIHQTGDARKYNDFERLTTLKRKLPDELSKRYIVKKFIMPDEIGWVYKNSDIIVGRSGANTVSELIALGKKAVLIPLSFSQNDEQLVNAKYYESLGLGEYLEEKDIGLDLLMKKIEQIHKRKVPISKTPIEKDAVSKIIDVTLSSIR